MRLLKVLLFCGMIILLFTGSSLAKSDSKTQLAKGIEISNQQKVALKTLDEMKIKAFALKGAVIECKAKNRDILGCIQGLIYLVEALNDLMHSSSEMWAAYNLLAVFDAWSYVAEQCGEVVQWFEELFSQNTLKPQEKILLTRLQTSLASLTKSPPSNANLALRSV